MNAIKTLALVSALFAAQSAMATSYDFGTMGPPATKSITAASDLVWGGDLDTFTFSINAPANASGSAPDSTVLIPYFNILITNVDVWTVKLLDSTGTQIGATDNTTESFSFANLAAGSYKLVVNSFGIGDYKVTLTTTPLATAVPENDAYAMMLAGLGLVGFAARRKLAA